MIKKTINYLSEFSIPLIAGVITSLLLANLVPDLFRAGEGGHGLAGFFHKDAPSLFGNLSLFHHSINFNFLINDIFMVIFFGIATVEITQSVLPGGSLYPIKRAINPLLGTLGGVVGPIVLYLSFCALFDRQDAVMGFGIPTATDIALAWLVARLVFGPKHPAVSFLLLLAIADDAIGLIIIAVFYTTGEVNVLYLGITLVGMLVCYLFRKNKIHSIWPYIIIGGGLSWVGLMLTHVHPALALVFIVPFLPHDNAVLHKRIFDDEPTDKSSLAIFEHTFEYSVVFGLFGFGLANAGVEFAGVNMITWFVLVSLLMGKTLGVSLFSWIGTKIGLPLPDGMDNNTLFLAGIVAGIGLTVALFVCGVAFPDNESLEGGAKMGALFSSGIAILAIVLGRVLKIKKAM